MSQSNSKERALDVFTAGIANGEYGLPEQDIVVMEKGRGCQLWTAEGDEFLDMSMGWGSVLVGHANPKVVEAVQAQAVNGSNFAYLNTHSLALAEEIKRISPTVDSLRFCASGTEATMYCQRLARAFTGREKILKFEGAYHGANEAGVTSLFASGTVNFPTPELTSAGTPAAARQLLVAPYNDTVALRSILSENKDEIAAILMEPLQRCTPPQEGYLQAVRDAANEFGVLLIFDEVVTGFRLAYGGAQEYYGISPDLIAYGKALGGGYPIGAFGGRADIMEQVNEHRIGGGDYVWMASTLGGNPISTAAANAALGEFRTPGTYPRLHALGQYLREQMAKALNDRGIVGQIIGDGPLAQVVFSPDPVFDYRSTKKGDSVKGRALMLALFRRRVFLNPMGTKLYISIAHDNAAIDELIARFGAALDEIN